MRVELPEEYYELGDVVSRVLDRHAAVTALRDHWEGRGGPGDGTLWRELARLGLGSLTVPERSGGAALPYLATVLPSRLFGTYAVAEPVLETSAVVCPFLAAAGWDAAADVLEAVRGGSKMATVQDGWESLAPWGADVGAVLVADDDGVSLCDPSHGRPERATGVDPARRPARVDRSAERIRLEGRERAEHLRTMARVAVAAALWGLGDAVVRRTVEYAKVRQQFGRPIGSFQAVKHQLADAWVDLQVCWRYVWKAAYLVERAGSGEAAAEAVTASRVAKALTGDAALRASYAGLQVHGGIGYTWECDLHLWLKRIQVLDASFGSSATHWEAAADAWFPE